MTADQVSIAVKEGQAIGDTVLATIEGLAPGVEVPAAAAQVTLDLLAQFATKALSAWSAASGQPITPESVLALLPDMTPLDAPDA